MSIIKRTAFNVIQKVYKPIDQIISATISGIITKLSGSTVNSTTQKINFTGSGVTSVVTNGVDTTQVDVTISGGSGETNTASNVGTGTGLVFKQKTGVDLELKTIKQGTGITITNNASDITIDSTGGGGVIVQDEGSPLSTTATTLNFVGSGVTATGTGVTKTITINGGSVGGSSIYVGTSTLSQTFASGTHTIIPSGIGNLTLPPNFFTPGKVLKIRASYEFTVFSFSATSALKLGSTTLLSPPLNSSGLTEVEYIITCRTGGASGVFEILGVNYDTSSTTPVRTLVTGIDLTPSLLLDMVVTFATDNISTYDFIVESGDGVGSSLDGDLLYVGTSTFTSLTTGSEYSVVPSGLGNLTLPSNFFTTGKVLKTFITQEIGISTGSTALKIKLGGTLLITTNNFGNLNTNTTIDVTITCRTGGASGVLEVTLQQCSDTTPASFVSSVLISGIDLTSTLLLDVRFDATSVTGIATHNIHELLVKSENGISGFAQSTNNTIYVGTSTYSNITMGSEYSVVPSGLGNLTLPANYFTVGKILKISTTRRSTIGTGTGILKFKFGGTLLETTDFINGDGNITTELLIVCRTEGASGVLEITKKENRSGNTFPTNIVSTTISGIDLTPSLLLDMRFDATSVTLLTLNDTYEFIVNSQNDVINVSGISDLDSLTDTVITSPSSGQVLKYNGSNWINSVNSGFPYTGSNIQDIASAGTFSVTSYNSIVRLQTASGLTTLNFPSSPIYGDSILITIEPTPSSSDLYLVLPNSYKWFPVFTSTGTFNVQTTATSNDTLRFPMAYQYGTTPVVVFNLRTVEVKFIGTYSGDPTFILTNMDYSPL